MLKHILDFAIKNNLYKDVRYREKHIRYHIYLDANGNMLDIEESDKKEKTVCPAYPARKLRGDTADFLVNKGCVIFDKNNKKFNNYYNDIVAAADVSNELNVIKMFLEKEHTEDVYLENIENLKNTNDLISFRINNEYVETADSWKEYFENKFNEYLLEDLEKGQSSSQMISVITGDTINPIRLTDNIQVGGATTSTGDVIICCDKDAYQSYGLDGAFNGAISKEESEKIKFGLEYLLANNYNRKWNLIHWYDKDINLDIINTILDPSFLFDDGFIDTPGFEDIDKNEKDRQIYNFLTNLFKNGKLVQDYSELSDVKYYLLNFKPCNGRIAFSGFRVGTFNKLFENLMLFYKDSEMLKRYELKEDNKSIWKESIMPILNIYSVFLNCLNSKAYKKKTDGKTTIDKKKQFELAEKEFSILKKQQLFNAIINNQQIPYDFFKRAVLNIRNERLSGERPSFVLYQILKTYLNREKRLKGEKENIMPTLNIDNKDIPYNLGRLFCVYGKIQEAALGNVNASVIDRYYASASSSPAYVFGRLATLSNYHLGKIKNPGVLIYYKKLLQEIASNIETFPKTLNIYEQANFALGYYQQEQDFYTKKQTNFNIEEDNNNE